MTHPQEIADEFTNYYSALYSLIDNFDTPQPSTYNIQQFLEKLALPTLPEGQLQELNAPITLKCPKS